ncbi:uncharacterized protein METZ01_LOCUS318318, partial [marine metagenome]
DPRRSDPCVVSSPITVTASTISRYDPGSTAASPACRPNGSSSWWQDPTMWRICVVLL